MRMWGLFFLLLANAVALFFCVAAVTLAGHLAWLFDWNGTATGSSTSALVFLFLPTAAFAAGGLGLAAGYAAEAVLRKLLFLGSEPRARLTPN